MVRVAHGELHLLGLRLVALPERRREGGPVQVCAEVFELGLVNLGTAFLNRQNGQTDEHDKHGLDSTLLQLHLQTPTNLG